jgi:hypothetical protein
VDCSPQARTGDSLSEFRAGRLKPFTHKQSVALPAAHEQSVLLANLPAEDATLDKPVVSIQPAGKLVHALLNQ